MKPWERGNPETAKVAEPGHPNPLTRDELTKYLEQSRLQALARIDAQNFEMEMRRDFAERRLNKLQQS